MAHERACSTIPKVVAFAFRSFNSPFNVVFRPSPNSVINVSLSLSRLDPPVDLDQRIDHDDAQSPPPLNHPPTWTLGAYAPSEDLGTQSNGMGAGMAGKDTAPAEEEDQEEAQQDEKEGEEEEEEEEDEEEDAEEDEDVEEGEDEEEAEEGEEGEAEEEDDQEVEDEEDDGDEDDDEKDPEDEDEADE